MKPIQIIALVVLSAGLASGATLFFVKQNAKTAKNQATGEPTNTADFCNELSVMRNHRNALTQPVLLVNSDCESKELEPLKNQIAQRVEQLKKEQKVTRVSVFYKEMTSVHWTGVNQNDGFYPGSLLKLPLLMNVLKLSESNPALLDQRFVFNGGLNLPVLEAPETALVPGKDYSVRELLRLCIAESSNDATTMLINVFNKDLYKDLFAEVEITVPELEDKFYKIS
ncbi:MAG: serine hydrolase, partial [Flavobacteriales bacterium]